MSISDISTGAQGADPFLVLRAARIRHLGKLVLDDVVEIGRLLTECRDHLEHGQWLPWLDTEFGWSDRTALNFMRVHEMVATKSETVADLDLPLSTLYLLAAPSTPPEVRDEIIERAEAGEEIKVADVKAAIQGGKKSAKKAKPVEAVYSTGNLNEQIAHHFTGAAATPEPVPAVEIEIGAVEYPEQVKKNILDTVDCHCAVVKAYKKILKASVFEPGAKDEISAAIGRLVSKWQALQAALAPVAPPPPDDAEPAVDLTIPQIAVALKKIGNKNVSAALDLAPNVLAEVLRQHKRPRTDKNMTNMLRAGLGTNAPAANQAAITKIQMELARLGLDRNDVSIVIRKPSDVVQEPGELHNGRDAPRRIPAGNGAADDEARA